MPTPWSLLGSALILLSTLLLGIFERKKDKQVEEVREIERRCTHALSELCGSRQGSACTGHRALTCLLLPSVGSRHDRGLRSWVPPAWPQPAGARCSWLQHQNCSRAAQREGPLQVQQRLCRWPSTHASARLVQGQPGQPAAEHGQRAAQRSRGATAGGPAAEWALAALQQPGSELRTSVVDSLRCSHPLYPQATDLERPPAGVSETGGAGSVVIWPQVAACHVQHKRPAHVAHAPMFKAAYHSAAPHVSAALFW